MSILIPAAVIAGFIIAVFNVGASRVFWAVVGYKLGKRETRK